jgi:hypothetical protein
VLLSLPSKFMGRLTKYGMPAPNGMLMSRERAENFATCGDVCGVLLNFERGQKTTERIYEKTLTVWLPLRRTRVNFGDVGLYRNTCQACPSFYR